MAIPSAIRVGIGGWDFDPWRGTFYPEGLAKTKQLDHASRRMTVIEINATFYKLQKAELFERWAAAVPDGFQFAIKGSRFCSNRKVLAEAGEAVDRFCGQGLGRLGDKLGPILWQFMATKKFDPDDFAAFLALLPDEVDGVKLRHAVEVRHESFADPRFFDLARSANVAICVGDEAGAPDFPHDTADFVYARLKSAREDEPQGYHDAELDAFTERARSWAAAGREVYMFMINGAKVRAPAAAEAVIERLKRN